MKIAIIGCGNMGLIYAKAFQKYEIVKKEHLLLVEKNIQRAAELEKLNIGQVALSYEEQIKEYDLLVLSVKPQDFDELSASLSKVINQHAVILSIMAGVKISHIKKMLNHDRIVRAMPNSPAALGMGVTGIYAGEGMDATSMLKAERVLATTGRTVLLEDEDLLNAVTALSGSGPAYFFYFLKHLIQAGVNMGLEESVAAMLAKQTMLGAFHLANNADQSLENLIKAVASKGGTTEAALNVFNQMQTGESIEKAVEAACKRAFELSSAAQK
ncbi:MAG: pyrroline-5-carboxylate reductase [Flavobacteriales bacterium]